MTVLSALDAAGRRRAPATLAGDHADRSAAQHGDPIPRRPADGGRDRGGHAPLVRRPSRLGVRAMIVVVWRAGPRIRKRSRSPSTTSTTGADRSRSAAATADAGVRSGWTSGRGAAPAVAERMDRPTDRPAAGRGQPPPSARESGRCEATRGCWFRAYLNSRARARARRLHASSAVTFAARRASWV
jgi:hypothetical protein